MEFNEKLQELRRRTGLTQEELADALHVSRAAVSKWESGRGLPGIDSLKDISRHFSVSLDELLSSESLLSVAESEGRRRAERSFSMALGLIDCAMVLLAILPVFALREGAAIQSVTLFALLSVRPVLFAVCVTGVAAMLLLGFAALVCGEGISALWRARGRVASLALTCSLAFVLIVAHQPYAAALALTLLAMKAFLLMRGQ